MSGDDIKAAVDAIPHWYHRIELPGGVVTPGWAPMYPDFYKLPGDFTGKRVLDVGAWDGYWTFEALKRGAREVVAIDDFSDTIHNGERRSWQQFELCRDILGYSREVCRNVEMSVYDVTPERLGRFDVVLMFGVLYHLKHPLLALEKLAAVTDDRLCLESAVLDHYSPHLAGKSFAPVGYGDAMVMEFYPGSEYGGNPTNWWVPTSRVIAWMLHVVGFKEVASWKITHPSSPAECRGFAQARKGTQ